MLWMVPHHISGPPRLSVVAVFGLPVPLQVPLVVFSYRKSRIKRHPCDHLHAYCIVVQLNSCYIATWINFAHFSAKLNSMSLWEGLPLLHFLFTLNPPPPCIIESGCIFIILC